MKTINWNDNWYFWEMYNTFALLWDVPRDAVQVKLPHDAMLQHRPYDKSALGGHSGYRDGGHFCYSKSLEIEDPMAAKYILHFDGVYENAALYVNGNLILRHPYGYTPFLADITPYLENGKNEIRVMTNNKAPNSRWYTGGGIYRDVQLLTADDPVYIRPGGVRIRTTQIAADHSSAKVEISASVCNEAGTAVSAKLKFHIQGSREVWSEPFIVDAAGEATVSVSAEIRKPHLWSGTDPALMICQTILHREEEGICKPMDSCEIRFGIRTLGMDPHHGFQVNGESVKLRGACIHPDNGPMGAAEIRDAVVRKVRILKESGFNAIRVSHHPASSVLLDVCDELGVYVMNECFDVWTRNKTDYDYANYFPDWWERDVEAMVYASYNHPSVVMYSLGNEIPEIGLRKGQEVCRMLQDKVKQIDDTRYTTVAINGVFSVGDVIPEIVEDVLGPECVRSAEGNVNEFLTIMDQNVDKIVIHDKISERVANAANIVDVCGYNYMIARYEKDVREYPDRMIVGSETYPSQIGRIWDIVQKYPQIIGDFTWTGWDYIGEAGLGVPAFAPGEGGFGASFPCQLAYIGDMDLTGFRRPVSYCREIVYGLRTDPYIAVNNPAWYQRRPFLTPWVLTAGIASWDYPGMEGQPVSVEVFSPGDEVELFLNGRSEGKKQTEQKENGKAEYSLLYEPGTLCAVSYRNGIEIGKMVLQTPKEQYHLCACVEEPSAELVYVDISCQDEDGILYQSCEEKVHVRVEGALESWLGTGNPKPTEHYLDMETALWNGRALLIVRKNDWKDKVSVTIWNEKESIKRLI